jgi:hypothetical protein
MYLYPIISEEQNRVTNRQGTRKKNRAEPLNFPAAASIFPGERIEGMSGMKSAYELAMERLGGETSSLTEQQKQAITELDSKMKARMAETEIMFSQQSNSEPDPAKAALIEQTKRETIAKIRADIELEKDRIRQK